MRTSAAMLVLTLLAFAASSNRTVAQQDSCPAGAGDEYVYSDFGQDVYAGGDCGCRGPRVWGSIEYMLAFRKARHVPPLVTTSTPGTSQTNAGVLGLDSTSILFGDGGIEDNPQSGLRGEIGLWLDSAARIGVGGSFMGLIDESTGYSAVGSANTILARPFYNTLIDQEASQLVAFPSLVSGSINVENKNQVTNAEVFLRQQIGVWPTSAPLVCLADTLAMKFLSLFSMPGTQVVSIQEFNTQPGTPMTRVDFLAGYQYSRIDDSLTISNFLTSLDPSYLGQIGTTLDAFDRFDVRNDFHGGTIGLKSVTSQGRWSLSMLGKVGLGNMREIATVDGQTIITLPSGPSATFVGGLLTQESNIGVYSQDRFAVVPEARIMVHYDLTCNVNVGIGYDFMYWNRVALSGDQIDTNVDVSQTHADPTFVFNERDFFVHSMTFLLQASF